MDSGAGDSDQPSAGREDGDHPSLRDLAEKVNQRRASEGELPEFGSAGSSDGDEETERFDLDAFRPEEPVETFGSDPKTEAIIEVVGGASNLLLLGPLLTPADHDLCTRLTTAWNDPDNLLLVTLTESPDERVAVFQGYLDQLPDRTVIVNVGDSTRSGSRETIQIESGPITIETLADPTDLMRLGITISRILSDLGEHGGNTAVCLHSLTALLQFATDPKTVFRFVHVLRGRLQAAGAHAHFHMDPAAHDAHTIETFRPLFDEVLTFDEDGTLRVDH